MKIGLSYDLKDDVKPTSSATVEDALEEYDSAETLEALRAAIAARRHNVVKLGGGRSFLQNVLKEQVDFVFNISEGLGSYRSREAQVPSVLEMLDIPYSGADPQCLAVCLDKQLTKKIVSWEGVNTPKWQVAALGPAGEQPVLDWHALRYPVFVKPVWEGSSKGIRLNSLVREPVALSAMVTDLLERYQQPVLIEEYVAGEEVTVGMIGNNPPRILGIMRVVPRQKNADFVYSLEVKRDYENLVDYECPANLPEDTIREIEEFSQKAFAVLGCRDFARVDYRISPDGQAYFLEINPLAGLNPRSSDIIIMGRLLGIPYNDLIGSILDAALARYRL